MLNDIYQNILDWSGGYAWVLYAFAVVFLVLLCDLVLRIVLRRLKKKLANTDNLWDDAVVAALQGPATLLVWIVGITYAAEITYADTAQAIVKAVVPIRTIGTVGAITWFLTTLISRLQEVVITHPDKNKKRLDHATVNAVGKLLRASILITAGLFILQTLGFSISGVLAFGGIGGIAVGFAARDLLANFFGGLILYLDRPFAVGDWVHSPDREIEGTVEDIGWRLTRIRAFDMQPIYVPNGAFSTMTIVNASRMSHRRIYETIGIRYGDAAKMKGIVDEVKAMLDSHPDIDNKEMVLVNFNTFAPSSLDFLIYAYTKTTVWAEFHSVKQDVLFKISDIINAAGAQIAYPTTTLDLPGELSPEVFAKR